jgi:hypothetical protein
MVGSIISPPYRECQKSDRLIPPPVAQMQACRPQPKVFCPLFLIAKYALKRTAVAPWRIYRPLEKIDRNRSSLAMGVVSILCNFIHGLVFILETHWLGFVSYLPLAIQHSPTGAFLQPDTVEIKSSLFRVHFSIQMPRCTNSNL